MHSRYAAVFGIENLELNQHYSLYNQSVKNSSLRSSEPTDSSSSDNQSLNNQPTDVAVINKEFEPITLSSQLLADIKRAAVPIAINSVVQSAALQLHDDQLGLTTPKLKTADKRALWALMSNHLDKL
ncbi:hypothetical protein PTRA_a0736 [Pseudoalteromonas translucida KMM 520]|uniref:Uncharacterized protein n=1 Tax=Pseudoalteromonas translucida KMM 520 TaxID=1315283 RepID=A0A0U2WWS8_9GAMM|nr:hypothetical protein [Pseudoalteromonas translucida]ALS32057.1 hypothetical protein PTRA_a0736 [Pseudoalteromonas translucida KMM 520]